MLHDPTIHHTIAVVSFVLGVLGSFYLSYDLLGKPGGPLRLLLVAVSSGILGLVILGVPSIVLGALFPLPTQPTLFTPLGAPRPFNVGVISYFVLAFFSSALVYAGYSALVPKDEDAVRQFPNWSQWRSARLLGLPPSAVLILTSILMAAAFAYAGAHEYSVSANPNYLIHYGASILGGLILLIGLVFGLPVLVNGIDNLEKRRLGSIGAFLTLAAFAIQLVLELST
jgi:hypothetical protein